VGLLAGCFLAVLIVPVRQKTYPESFFEALSLSLLVFGPLFVGVFSASAIGTKEVSLRVRLAGIIALALLLSGFVYLLLPVLGASDLMTEVTVVGGGDQPTRKTLPLLGYQFLAGVVAVVTFAFGMLSSLTPTRFTRGRKA